MRACSLPRVSMPHTEVVVCGYSLWRVLEIPIHHEKFQSALEVCLVLHKGVCGEWK